jgi:hypothetical protein
MLAEGAAAPASREGAVRQGQFSGTLASFSGIAALGCPQLLYRDLSPVEDTHHGSLLP